MFSLKKNIMELNKIELDAAHEVINIGLSKSADSMSFFLGSRVLIKSFDLEFKNLNNELWVPEKKDNHIHVLETEIKGDVSGKCFLLFTEEEKERFAQKGIPESYKSDKEKYEEMAKGLLLEADNIITASVLTQFANLLDIKIYGDVPSYQYQTIEEFSNSVNHQRNEKYHLMCFNAFFETEADDYKPEFIWLLNETFLDKIKDWVKNYSDSKIS